MSYSKKNVLRGLHLQTRQTQTKLITVLKGKIFDVCVDCRKNSKTFGKYVSCVLNSKKKNLLWVPKGFAHGFVSLSEIVRVDYQVDNYYNLENEFGINPFDNDLNINWILDKNQIIINKRDRSHKNLSESPVYKF